MKTLACRINEDGSIDNFSIWSRKLSKEEVNILKSNDYNYIKFYIWNWQVKLIKNKTIKFCFNEYLKLEEIDNKVKKEIFKAFDNKIKNPH